jgi:integrase
MDRHFPDGGERTVDQLVEDYIENRRQIDRRPATIRDIRGTLGRANPASVERERGGSLQLAPTGFAHDFAGVPVAHVTTADLERWMERHKGKATATRRKFRVHMVGLFNFAKARKYVKENPAEPLGTPNTSKMRPYVMPVEDVEAVMRYAAANEAETVPYFALALFAGIRPQGELSRLTWADISFERREIDIREDVSKTGDERFIAMSDNLVSWLLPHRKAAGPVDATRKAVERVRRGAGVRWEPDCMRHSFGSYHMAAFENAGKTALQMGHREIDTTFEHYRRAVRKKDAVRFWKIRPDSKAANVIPFRAVAG